MKIYDPENDELREMTKRDYQIVQIRSCAYHFLRRKFPSEFTTAVENAVAEADIAAKNGIFSCAEFADKLTKMLEES